ncbi:hypothetical protein D3C71_26340 [compost metagenome]
MLNNRLLRFSGQKAGELRAVCLLPGNQGIILNICAKGRRDLFCRIVLFFNSKNYICNLDC